MKWLKIKIYIGTNDKQNSYYYLKILYITSISCKMYKFQNIRFKNKCERQTDRHTHRQTYEKPDSQRSPAPKTWFTILINKKFALVRSPFVSNSLMGTLNKSCVLKLYQFCSDFVVGIVNMASRDQDSIEDQNYEKNILLFLL